MLPAASLADVGALAYQRLGGVAWDGFRATPQLPKAANQRGATKLTYFMTDDGPGHQSPDSLRILDLLDQQPQRNIHNVVFRDGKENGDSRFFYMQGHGQKAESTVAPKVNEVQSNNPQVLSQIINAAYDTYPGQRHYFQLYTHGGGLFGVGMDKMQTDPNGKELAAKDQIFVLPITQFAEALKQGLKGRQMDLIYNQACLMGNVEALYELRGTSRYILASEDSTYSTDNFSLTMTKLFDELANKGAEPATIAREMAIQGQAKHFQRPDGSYSGFTTLAAFDMDRIDEVKTTVNQLALALIAALPKERSAIMAAYTAVPTVTGKAQPESPFDSMRDLWGFTAQLDKQVADAGVKAALQRVRTEQKRLMLHEKDSFGSAANGLSIFMPLPTHEEAVGFLKGKQLWTIKGTYDNLRFAKETAWGKFLKTLLAGK
jgi:muconolactone delta-isomerase